MQSVYTSLIENFEFTNDILKDGYNFLIHNNYPKIAEHSLQVAEEAKALAQRFNVNVNSALAAGILHDISVVFPNSKRVEVSKELGIEVLKEEEEFPLILHQKISKVMAEDIFAIKDSEVLSAISCHTTLKSNPSQLDMVIFTADKLKWDQTGIPPYYNDVIAALESSLEEASLSYINYLLNNKSGLKVLHPWLMSAYRELNGKINIKP